MPQFERQRCDVSVTESRDAVTVRSRMGVPISFVRMLHGFPRVLVPRQMLRFSLLFANPMGVGCDVVQFGGALVVFVMGSVVIPGGHTKF